MARRRKQDYPGWMWMLFGLSIGLSVAFAVWVRDRGPVALPGATQAVSLQNALDENGEVIVAKPEESPQEERFRFYDILPNFVFIIPEKRPDIEADIAPQAIVEPGVYVLQAGSFSTVADAERRRAVLALQGIESHIQRVKIDDRNYYRVYIGPTDDLDELNMLRSRLRAAKIDVLRIRISD